MITAVDMTIGKHFRPQTRYGSPRIGEHLVQSRLKQQDPLAAAGSKRRILLWAYCWRQPELSS
jgi:hypothetical protein